MKKLPCVISQDERNEDTLHVGVDASVKNGVMAGHIVMTGYMTEWSITKTIASRN